MQCSLMKAQVWSLCILPLLAVAIGAQDEMFGDRARSGAKVVFLGRSPNFRVFVNESDRAQYLQLKFGKIAELREDGTAEQGHAINSLAAAAPAWTSGSTTSLDGQSVSYARMTLDLSTLGNSFRPCSGGGAGNGNGNNNGNGNGNGSSNSGHRRLLQVEPASYVRITVLFGIVNDTVFQYGQGENITVKQGGLKFNIEQKGWPFCANSSLLSIDMDVLTKTSVTPSITETQVPRNATASNSTAEPGRNSTRPLPGKKGVLALGGGWQADMRFADYAFESVSGTTKQNVTVSVVQRGAGTSINFRFPAANTLYYDPDVVLADTGLEDTNTVNNPGDSAAGSLKPSLLALLGVIMLSAMLPRV